ncbi:glycosyltransferase family 2 protein [Robiginitalea sediminis]|uniref:glycosyltransferase family 2 protein n=1 Tax=Robiginitalea sediminis TaxID=1982593 RepID=UPI000B4B0F84|nr:glycosyltransferase family 2 protein [Robiginitalea sediminis]
MDGKTPRLAVIIPAHNEAGNLGECLKSFARQSRKPDALIVVDDHSTDRTGSLAQAFAEGHPWVRVVRRRSGPEHRPGAKVVESFRFGLETLAEPFDFIGKFDADIILPENYFEKVLEAFEADPLLGICGGHMYIRSGDDWAYEPIANHDHVRGPIKCYRRSCLEAMGGLRPYIGWDTADMILARYHGFSTRTLPELEVHHLRPTGGAYSASHGEKQGASFYHLRYGWIIAGIASLKLAWKARNPLLPLRHLKGYFRAASGTTGRLLSPEEGRFARQLRWRGIRSRLV